MPADTRTRFIVAAMVFVTGAVGFEMLGGAQVEAHGTDLLYRVFSHLEEMMEMLGITLFVRAMLYYIADHVGEMRLRIDLVDRAAISPSPVAAHHRPTRDRPAPGPSLAPDTVY